MVMMLYNGPGKHFGSTIRGEVGIGGVAYLPRLFLRHPELTTKVMVAEGERNDVTWDVPEMSFHIPLIVGRWSTNQIKRKLGQSDAGNMESQSKGISYR